jgi:hypothetical protein
MSYLIFLKASSSVMNSLKIVTTWLLKILPL